MFHIVSLLGNKENVDSALSFIQSLDDLDMGGEMSQNCDIFNIKVENYYSDSDFTYCSDIDDDFDDKFLLALAKKFNIEWVCYYYNSEDLDEENVFFGRCKYDSSEGVGRSLNLYPENLPIQKSKKYSGVYLNGNTYDSVLDALIGEFERVYCEKYIIT